VGLLSSVARREGTIIHDLYLRAHIVVESGRRRISRLTYLELNPVKVDPSNRPKITVYSGEHVFEQPAGTPSTSTAAFTFPCSAP